MNTTRNRADVLAVFLRAAVKELREIAPESRFTEWRAQYDTAVACVETVAEQLEEIAAEEDKPP